MMRGSIGLREQVLLNNAFRQSQQRDSCPVGLHDLFFCDCPPVFSKSYQENEHHGEGEDVVEQEDVEMTDIWLTDEIDQSDGTMDIDHIRDEKKSIEVQLETPAAATVSILQDMGEDISSTLGLEPMWKSFANVGVVRNEEIPAENVVEECGEGGAIEEASESILLQKDYLITSDAMIPERKTTQTDGRATVDVANNEAVPHAEKVPTATDDSGIREVELVDFTTDDGFLINNNNQDSQVLKFVQTSEKMYENVDKCPTTYLKDIKENSMIRLTEDGPKVQEKEATKNAGESLELEGTILNTIDNAGRSMKKTSRTQDDAKTQVIIENHEESESLAGNFNTANDTQSIWTADDRQDEKDCMPEIEDSIALQTSKFEGGIVLLESSLTSTAHLNRGVQNPHTRREHSEVATNRSESITAVDQGTVCNKSRDETKRNVLVEDECTPINMAGYVGSSNTRAKLVDWLIPTPCEGQLSWLEKILPRNSLYEGHKDITVETRGFQKWYPGDDENYFAFRKALACRDNLGCLTHSKPDVIGTTDSGQSILIKQRSDIFLDSKTSDFEGNSFERTILALTRRTTLQLLQPYGETLQVEHLMSSHSSAKADEDSQFFMPQDLATTVSEEAFDMAIRERNVGLKSFFEERDEVEDVIKGMHHDFHNWFCSAPSTGLQWPHGGIICLYESRSDIESEGRVEYSHNMTLIESKGAIASSHLFDLSINGSDTESRIREARWSISSEIQNYLSARRLHLSCNTS